LSALTEVFIAVATGAIAELVSRKGVGTAPRVICAISHMRSVCTLPGSSAGRGAITAGQTGRISTNARAFEEEGVCVVTFTLNVEIVGDRFLLLCDSVMGNLLGVVKRKEHGSFLALKFGDRTLDSVTGGPVGSIERHNTSEGCSEEQTAR
jgi:hypothetical protein